MRYADKTKIFKDKTMDSLPDKMEKFKELLREKNRLKKENKDITSVTSDVEELEKEILKIRRGQ